MSEHKKEEVEKISIGSHVNTLVACHSCGKSGVAADFFSYQGKKNTDLYLCEDCRVRVNTELEAEASQVNMGGAVGLGVIAASIGGVIWFYITIFTQTEFGYVAIGLGYLIGMGIFIGAGKKRSQQLQILALVLTLAAIFITEHAIFVHVANDYLQSHLSEFPNFQAGDRVGFSFFNPDFLNSLVSPIGLIIYALAAYVAFKFLKPRKI